MDRGGAGAVRRPARGSIVAHARGRGRLRRWRGPEARAGGGAWVAGYVAYEAGYALEPKLARLMPRTAAGPLVALGVFDGAADGGCRCWRGRPRQGGRRRMTGARAR